MQRYQEINGRWTAQPQWQAARTIGELLLVATMMLLIFYPTAHRTAVKVSSEPREVPAIEAAEESPCLEVASHEFDCTTDLNALKKWRNWQEKQSKKETAKIRISPVSAYTSEARQTDSSPCIAADGSDICKRFARGETLCASNDYPLGSRLGLGGDVMTVCVVSDRMNKRYTGTGRVDFYLGYNTKAAWAWGVKQVPVTLLSVR